MKNLLFLSLAACLQIELVLGYYGYQMKVPNGQHVPHPCKPNFIWHGLGHKNSLGGGSTNPFGQDFARNGHQWTKELCQADSDMDGLTNGQELGDPQCVWKDGDIPSRVDNITHPGICDPWGSDKCGAQNSWVSCDTGEFKCDAINAPDVRNVTLRFPRTLVPAKETTYSCFVFDFPSEETVHVIASKPYIDNPNVMHHIVVFSCSDDAKLIDTPTECNMGISGCNNVVAVWTLGMAGECIHPMAGFRLGKGANTRLALQFHWTNKGLVDDWYDASGLTLFYTPKLRPNDAGVMIIGQNYLAIPPGEKKVTYTGTCSSRCTDKWEEPIKVLSALNHMHYLGIAGQIEHKRGDHVIQNITDDRPYSYDSPIVHMFDEPLEVRPGDQLKMFCEFSSLNRERTTLDGEGSYEEMCYGLLTYYPASSIQDSCIQWKDLDFCDMGECDLRSFYNATLPKTKFMIDEILGSCFSYGYCRPECPAVLAKYRKKEPCLKGQMGDFNMNNIMRRPEIDGRFVKMVAAFQVCDAINSDQSQQSQTTTTLPSTHVKCPTSSEVKESGSDVQKPVEAPQNPQNPVIAFLEIAKVLGDRPLLQNIIFNNNQQP